jgi:hypothetical protein
MLYSTCSSMARSSFSPGGRSNSSGYGHFKLPHLTING